MDDFQYLPLAKLSTTRPSQSYKHRAFDVSPSLQVQSSKNFQKKQNRLEICQ